MAKQRVETIVFQVKETLETLDCADCGVVFALTTDFIARRREDGKSFHCPNGHRIHFSTQQTNEQKIKDLEERVKREEARTKFERDQRKATERSLIATKGHVTRLRKHVQAGLCPYGCKRHFDDLERHIHSKHAGQPLPGEGE